MKTLADLKRDLIVGRKLILLSRFGKEVNEEKEIGSLQSNGLYLKKNGTPKGSWLDYPKASLLEYDGKSIKIFSRGKRPLTKEEKSIMDGYEKIRDKKQEEIDALSDGSSTFWQKERYYKEKGYYYLTGNSFEKGFKYDYNSGLIWDDNIKGELSLEYKLI